MSMQTLELCNSEVDETLVDLTCSAKQNVFLNKYFPLVTQAAKFSATSSFMLLFKKIQQNSLA